MSSLPLVKEIKPETIKIPFQQALTKGLPTALESFRGYLPKSPYMQALASVEEKGLIPTLKERFGRPLPQVLEKQLELIKIGKTPEEAKLQTSLEQAQEFALGFIGGPEGKIGKEFKGLGKLTPEQAISKGISKEEWIKGQSIAFHGSETKITKLTDQPIYLTDDIGAKDFGNVQAFYLQKGKTLDLTNKSTIKNLEKEIGNIDQTITGIDDIIDYAKKNGYDYIKRELPSSDYSTFFRDTIAVNPNKTLKTPSQLSSLYDEAVKGQELTQTLRGTKGLSAEDIMAKHPNIQLKRDIPATDIYGKKVTIPEGEALTPYELKGNKVLLQDGETYVVSKNQYQNIKGQSVVAEAKPFAPELQGLEESVRRSKIVMKDLNNVYEGIGDTKFSQYQLPGGKNYKEILIKAPIGDETLNKISQSRFNKTFSELADGDKTTVIATAKNAHPEFGGFKSSHSAYGEDATNLGGWIRLNEMKYKGKDVTFMEESQDVMSEIHHIDEAKKFIDEKFGGRNNFNVARIKRALQEAVANDSEYFAWINGEQTSARYNLSTQVDNVKWFKSRGGKSIHITTKDLARSQPVSINKEGIITEGIPDWKGKKLDEVLGKGLADSIMSKESGTLSGEGLKFGGEWATNLYDKQIKNIVENVTGGKVEVLDMGLPIEKPYKQNWLFEDRQGAIPVTKENIKIGDRISNSTRNEFIVTDILENGKFKAMPKETLGNYLDGQTPKEYLDFKAYEKRLVAKNGEGQRSWIDAQIKNRKKFLDNSSAEFNLKDTNPKTTTQQGIKLTPEIKARIRGEAPKIKIKRKNNI